MNASFFINGFMSLVLLPGLLLVCFYFVCSRSPFHSAAKLHWFFVLSLGAAFFFVLAAIASPKFIAIALPHWVSGFDWQQWASNYGIYLLAAYFLMAFWCLFYFLLGVLEVNKLSAKASLLSPSQLPPSIFIGDDLQKVVFKVSDRLSSPVTWGWKKPIVVLPTCYTTWDSARLQRVLIHELAHIRRKDWPTIFFVRVICSVLWYLPAVWFIARKIDWYAELACDDSVVQKLNCRAEYAGDLLDISANSKHDLFALSFNRSSRLYQRINSVLDGSRDREGMSGKLQIASVVLSLLVVLPLASIHASISERDLSLVGSEQKALYPLIIPEDSNGVNEAARNKPAVPPQAHNVVKPASVNIHQLHSFLASRRQLMDEEVVVRGEIKAELQTRKVLDQLALKELSDAPAPQVTFKGYLPLKMVTPQYPRRAISKHLEGKVIAQFDIDELGLVQNIRLVYSSPSKVFDRSVKKALKEFKFMPLKLNGQAIKTKNVTETFIFTLKEATTDNKPNLNYRGKIGVASAANKNPS